MKKLLKNEKGSVSLYALIAMLILMVVLLNVYIFNTQKQSRNLEITKQIKNSPVRVLFLIVLVTRTTDEFSDNGITWNPFIWNINEELEHTNQSFSDWEVFVFTINLLK